MFGKAPESEMTMVEALRLFLAVHWKGVVCLITPLVLLPIVLPPPSLSYQWCGYTLLIMAVYWVTECIPLPVTSFLPIVVFPLASVMTTTEVCKNYVNDTVLIFLGSIIMAFSIEQSGLHKRLAYLSIRIIGYSHFRPAMLGWFGYMESMNDRSLTIEIYKLLMTICVVTSFTSMWITNTAATTMMVPINFAILRIFENQKVLSIYEKDKEGELHASDITTAYFCSATYSATIGGIGTLIGTGTNLAFKGLFITAYPDAPDYLSFPLFSAFAIPFMILLETALYFCIAIKYFGLFRPNSKVARTTHMTKESIVAAKKAIAEDLKKMGTFSFWEGMTLVLFSGAMICFFSRSPTIFPGWGDKTIEALGIEDNTYIRDSALATIVCFAMFLLPGTLLIFRNFSAKFYEDLPKTRSHAVLIWSKVNNEIPYSFMFLLGGGFALSDAARKTGLNDKIGETLQGLKVLPNYAIILFIIIIVIFISNFASNVAVANVMAPLAMELARKTRQNPLWYCIVSGFSASFCFMLPVATPGNLIVKSAAKIPTKKMIVAGIGPTVCAIVITWIAMKFWAPVIWPTLHTLPAWAE